MANPEEELAKAKEEYEKAKAQAKARYEKTVARHSTAARKQDTRRKIILGGGLIELAERDREASRVLSKIVGTLSRVQDKKVFEDWEKPEPESGSIENNDSGSSAQHGGFNV